MKIFISDLDGTLLDEKAVSRKRAWRILKAAGGKGSTLYRCFRQNASFGGLYPGASEA